MLAKNDGWKTLRKHAGPIALGLVGIIQVIDLVNPGEALFPPYYKHVMFLGLAYAVLATSLNIVMGLVGQVSLGHAAFFGFGAYASAILAKSLGVPFWIAFPVAGVLAGLVAIPLGLPSIRVRGPFLVVVTYGFCEVLRFAAINMAFTGGPAGIPGVPIPSLFLPMDRIGATGKEVYNLLALLLLIVVLVFTSRLWNSQLGLGFRAVKDDDLAADAMGVNATWHKLLALLLAGVFAGLAGSLYAHYATYVSPDLFSSGESILVLAMVVVGGTGTMWGPVSGAFALTLVPQVLKWLKDVVGLRTDPWMTLFGVILIALMRLRPEGLTGIQRKGG